ncbi:MAG: site-specific DNA-methyltransferase [Syntrophomonas sp.]
MDIQTLLIERLNPAQYNPRKDLKPGDAQYEKLKRSIEVFGYVEPIVWNRQTGNIVGGHQSLKILQSMDISEAECVVVDLDEQNEKALNVALIKVNGEWDLPLLTDLLKDLGRHRLVCGGSTDPETYSILMQGQKANLVVTDPPYNVNYTAVAGTIKNDNLKDEDFYSFLLKAFSNMAASMEKDASIYVFHADTEGFNFRKAFKDAGFYLSGVCIWAKQSLVLGRSPYHWKHESVLFGWLKDGKHKWYGDRKQSTIWNFDRQSKNILHPTMKPVALCAYPIQNSSMSNCIVLDPFGGSGSALIACEQTNRICYTIELDEKYADVIVQRYIEQVGSDEGIYLLRDGVKRAHQK